MQALSGECVYVSHTSVILKQALTGLARFISDCWGCSRGQYPSRGNSPCLFWPMALSSPQSQVPGKDFNWGKNGYVTIFLWWQSVLLMLNVIMQFMKDGNKDTVVQGPSIGSHSWFQDSVWSWKQLGLPGDRGGPPLANNHNFESKSPSLLPFPH